jgi:hypothetical protein
MATPLKFNFMTLITMSEVQSINPWSRNIDGRWCGVMRHGVAFSNSWTDRNPRSRGIQAHYWSNT